MSLSILLIISILILGIIIGTAYALIVKKFGLDSFSMFKRDLYDKKEYDDEFYNRF